MNNGSMRDAYDILNRVYREGAFVNGEMKSVTSKRTAKLVYGVLDKHYELEYIADALTEKPAKANIKTLLYIGIYSLKFLNTPINVVLNETGDVLNSMGKNALKPFFSAVYNRVVRGEYSMPKKSDRRYTEVKYNMPSFLVGMFKKDYPENYEDIIAARVVSKTHIRLNNGVSEEEILRADAGAQKTLTGYFVKNNRDISLLNFEGKITYMSYVSTLAAESVANKLNGQKDVLDCCAAPGGKSVYLAQRGNKVTACDIYPHRAELIKSYAKRMKTPIEIQVRDATVYYEEWADKFDAVFCDVPCSGMGVVGRRKDVVFNKTYEGIAELTKLQKAILNNACKYVKRGGLLIYSTCTVFKMENGEVVSEFLSKHENFEREKIYLPFENDGELQFLPDGQGMEGFYLCHMKRKA